MNHSMNHSLLLAYCFCGDEDGVQQLAPYFFLAPENLFVVRRHDDGSFALTLLRAASLRKVAQQNPKRQKEAGSSGNA